MLRNAQTHTQCKCNVNGKHTATRKWKGRRTGRAVNRMEDDVRLARQSELATWGLGREFSGKIR